jgi:hypothetical protein
VPGRRLRNHSRALDNTPPGIPGSQCRLAQGVNDATMHTWGVSQKYPGSFTWNNHCL